MEGVTGCGRVKECGRGEGGVGGVWKGCGGVWEG